jgi:hypothetical protein
MKADPRVTVMKSRNLAVSVNHISLPAAPHKPYPREKGNRVVDQGHTLHTMLDHDVSHHQNDGHRKLPASLIGYGVH